MPSTKNCPVCANKSFRELIDFGNVPLSDYFLSNPDQEHKKIKLSFEYCLKCAFIRRRLDEDLHDYSQDNRTTIHLSPEYSSEIAGYFHKNGVKSNEFIIDIGSNDGSFLDVLSKSGFTNLLGVEPSAISSEICKSKGYDVERAFFNEKEASKIKNKYDSASVVICRHVLEHISDPFEFINSVRKALKEQGRLFIEVPNGENIINGIRAYDLWEEHRNHFTPNNLELLVNAAGFKVDKILIKPYASTNTILLWCSMDGAKDKLSNAPYLKETDACKNFSEKWNSLCEHTLIKLKNSKKPLFGIGASHPQTNFLIFSGIGNYVSKLIDDDPEKIGKYALVPDPIPIISTKQFLESKFSGTILNIAFGHDDWSNKIIDSAGKNIQVIDPYLKIY
jgi:2-polyprenyl-3-methyl-5-hydroxy-6-metoxy-1,4-benzoquinol methylase